MEIIIHSKLLKLNVLKLTTYSHQQDPILATVWQGCSLPGLSDDGLEPAAHTGQVFIVTRHVVADGLCQPQVPGAQMQRSFKHGRFSFWNHFTCIWKFQSFLHMKMWYHLYSRRGWYYHLYSRRGWYSSSEHQWRLILTICTAVDVDTHHLYNSRGRYHLYSSRGRYSSSVQQ